MDCHTDSLLFHTTTVELTSCIQDIVSLGLTERGHEQVNLGEISSAVEFVPWFGMPEPESVKLQDKLKEPFVLPDFSLREGYSSGKGVGIESWWVIWLLFSVRVYCNTVNVPRACDVCIF